jgi:hypothetical protein
MSTIAQMLVSRHSLAVRQEQAADQVALYKIYGWFYELKNPERGWIQQWLQACPTIPIFF